MSTVPSAGSEVTAPAARLSSDEAKRRLAERGSNEIHREKETSLWTILVARFKGAMIWLLLGACVVSTVLGEVADAVAIGAIVVLNVLVGFFREYRIGSSPARRHLAASHRSRHAPVALDLTSIVGPVNLSWPPWREWQCSPCWAAVPSSSTRLVTRPSPTRHGSRRRR